MTVDEFHRGVRLGLDKTDAYTYPSFTVGEIDYWINYTIDMFIRGIFFKSTKQRQAKYIEQANLEDIKEIIDYTEITPATTPTPTNPYYTFDLPASYKFYDSVDFTISRVADPYAGQTYKILGERLDNNLFFRTYNNLIQHPYTAKVPFTIWNNSITCYQDSDSTIDTLHLIFCEEPLIIDLAGTTGIGTAITTGQDMQFSESTLYKMIDLTVAILLENIESQRLNSQIQLQQANEQI